LGTEVFMKFLAWVIKPRYC